MELLAENLCLFLFLMKIGLRSFCKKFAQLSQQASPENARGNVAKKKRQEKSKWTIKIALKVQHTTSTKHTKT